MSTLADDGYRLLATRYVRKQLKQLRRQLDGVRRGDDIEFVHQARVASRRMNAALSMFANCFDPKSVKQWRKEIRRTLGGLGKARDKDVQIKFLCNALDRVEQKAHYPGVARLLVHLERRREELQPKVVDTVKRFESSGVADQMRAELKTLLTRFRKRRVHVNSPFVEQETQRHILCCLDKFLEHQSCLNDPDDGQRHHSMRIAAKKLRYTMEISAGAYADGLVKAIQPIKRIQSLLGDVHDCDVWIKYLHKRLEKERQRIVDCYGHDSPLERLKVGFDYLIETRRQDRIRLFGQLVDYWHELASSHYWDELIVSIRTHAPETSSPETTCSETNTPKLSLSDPLSDSTFPPGRIPGRPAENGCPNTDLKPRNGESMAAFQPELS